MLDVLSDVVRDVLNIDGFSATMLAVMVGWSALLLHIAVESKLYTTLYLPGMILGGLLSFYLARTFGIQLSPYRDANAIMLSLSGIVPGFVLTLLAIRLMQWVQERRRPLTIETRL